MNEGLLTLIVILGIAAIISIVSFVIYRALNPKLKEEKPSEDQVLKDELERVLKPIEDKDAAKAVSKYQEKDED